MTESEKTALSYLPAGLRDAAVGVMSTYTCPAAEIRVRLGGAVSLTMARRGGENAVCAAKCTEEDMKYILGRLCGGSLYAHAETIREGVILTAEGLRAGIAGRGVVTGGKIECVRDITSVNIRIPHRVPGAADGLYGLVQKYGSTCVVSPPGMGKTTMLRELIPLLAAKYRTAVIDTRFELAVPDAPLADFYPGWPRSEGICAAVRTMSPDYVICDEISTGEDADAVKTAAASGVTVAASAHGKNADSLRENPHIGVLFREGVFGCVCVIDEGGLLVMG